MPQTLISPTNSPEEPNLHLGPAGVSALILEHHWQSPMLSSQTIPLGSRAAVFAPLRNSVISISDSSISNNSSSSGGGTLLIVR